ncbi:MAG: DICT sensory domain-containing protein [Xenococcaceae cyanobacterium]
MLLGSILQQLTSAHRGSKRPLNLGVYYKNTLVSLCHALEDFVLETESKPLMVTAFQRGKWYLQEAERYGEIAEKAAEIAIMASSDAGFDAHPTSQRSNVSLVNLAADDPVAQEWHLMIISPTYTAMVLCQELSEADYGKDGIPQEDLERKFYGFWTFEPALVKEAVELSIAHIGDYDKELQQRLQQRVEKIDTESASRQREDLGKVVAKVIDYLQHCQENLHQDAHISVFSSSKALDDNLLSNEMQAFLRMAQIIDSTDLSNPMAAAEVSALAEAMGQLLDLPAWQIKRLRLAGWLHRLGTLPNLETLNSIAMQQTIEGEMSSATKASVLRIMPQMQAIANIINHQTENWNGSGTPDNFAYDNIPVESRIIRLVADFQQKVNSISQEASTDNPLLQVLADCQTKAGTIYDPKLVEALALLVMGMQQGMNISAIPPKIAAGMWLLDDREFEESNLL